MTNSSRPVVVQGGPGPIFAGEGAEAFLCHKCGNMLVERFEISSLIAIDLQCWRCGEITTTPAWPDDKPFHHAVVTLGDAGRLLVTGPVSLGKKASFTTDQEITRVNALMDVLRGEDAPVDITPEGLKAFIATLDVITNCRMSKELGKARRNRRSGTHPAIASPLAWAIARIEAQLQLKQLDLSGDDGVALNYLHVANHVFRRWSRHALAGEFARGLIDNLHHNATMLMVAAYLEQHGNKIGFTDAIKESGPSSDLYIDLNRADKVSIEIKAPPELQWPNLSTSASLEKTVSAQVKSAKKQITGAAGGLVVIGSSALGRRLETVVRELAARGRFSSRVAAVAIVTYPARGSFGHINAGALSANTEALVRPIRNPKFSGEDFLKI